MNIRQYIAGGVLFSGVCTITGRPVSEVSRCSFAHARAATVKNYPTVADAAIISEMRYKQATRLRQARQSRRAAIAEIEDCVSDGYLCTIQQFRRAGLIKP